MRRINYLLSVMLLVASTYVVFAEEATTLATATATVASTTVTTSVASATTETASSTENTTDSTNPFAENAKVTVVASATPTTIADVDVAKAAGINKIEEGFPIDGFVSNVGTDHLRLRSWPWGTVIGNYNSGTKLTVLGESGEFYLVEIDGKQGYMHKNYVSTTKQSASGKEPYYPGDTASGGALSLEDGVKASKDGAAGKVPTTTVASDNSSSSSSSGSSSGKVGGSTTGANGKINLTVPKQYQATTNCPRPWSACGPTSLSMILSYYNGKATGPMVTDLWNKCGTTAGSGTGHQGLQNGAKAYGYPNASWHYCVTQDWVRTQIKAGKPILAHVKGHYCVITGIDDKGNLYVNDPAQKQVERTFTWSAFDAWWRGAGSTRPCMILE